MSAPAGGDPAAVETGGAAIAGSSTSTTAAAAAPPPTASTTAEQFRKHFESLSVRRVVIRVYNIAVIATAFIALLLTVIAWGVGINYEGHQLKRRHIGAMIAFACALVTIAVDILSLHVQPNWFVLVGLQVGSVVTLFLNGVAVGMNGISVDVCAAGDAAAAQLHCASHYLEYVAGFILALCLASMFLTTQQKIVVFVDRGILKGLGNRLSRL